MRVILTASMLVLPGTSEGRSWNVFIKKRGAAATAWAFTATKSLKVKVPVAEVKAERTRRIQLLTATWCAPCKTLIADAKPWLERGGWEVGPSNTSHIQIVDVDENPEVWAAANAQFIPLAILMDNGKEVSRIQSPTRGDLVNLYNGTK